ELPDGGIVVVIRPALTDSDWLERLVRRPCKIILLGPLPERIAALAGIRLFRIDPDLSAAADCAPADVHGSSESEAVICYAPVGVAALSPLRERRCCRYDFANEWNNLGYGRIAIGGGPWSLAVTALPLAASVLAHVKGAPSLAGAVVTLRDTPRA